MVVVLLLFLLLFVVNLADAYESTHFNPEHDRETGFRTRSVLTVPSLSSDGSVLLDLLFSDYWLFVISVVIVDCWLLLLLYCCLLIVVCWLLVIVVC